MTRVTPASIAYIATQVRASFTFHPLTMLLTPLRTEGPLRSKFFGSVLKDRHNYRQREVLQ
jgi:hypothetical protein